MYFSDEEDEEIRGDQGRPEGDELPAPLRPHSNTELLNSSPVRSRAVLSNFDKVGQEIHGLGKDQEQTPKRSFDSLETNQRSASDVAFPNTGPLTESYWIQEDVRANCITESLIVLSKKIPNRSSAINHIRASIRRTIKLPLLELAPETMSGTFMEPDLLLFSSVVSTILSKFELLMDQISINFQQAENSWIAFCHNFQSELGCHLQDCMNILYRFVNSINPPIKQRFFTRFVHYSPLNFQHYD